MNSTIQNRLREGEALFAAGKIDDAERCFSNLLEDSPTSMEAFNNLGVIAFQKGQLEKAVDYFHASLRLDPFYKQAALNFAYILKELKLIHQARPFLEGIFQKYPEDTEIKELLDEVDKESRPRKRIAFLCFPGLQSFLDEIVKSVQKRHEAITCYSMKTEEMESRTRWADIVWLEWANELAIKLTNHPTLLDGKRVICRLHSYEALDGHARMIKWEKVTDLILVAEHIKDILLKQLPELPNKVKNIHIVPNGVNLDKFQFKEKEPGFKLAYVGHINFKKGPMLLLHAFRELIQSDNRYQLFIAGDFQDLRYEHYFSQMIKLMGLENHIRMEGWTDNVGRWLEDKQYIVCTSVLEGHPVGLMEAMACGLKPVIHNYVGARGTYPDKYLWNTIPEFVQMVKESKYDSKEYRNFIIENHYSLDDQIRNIERIIDPNKIGK